MMRMQLSHTQVSMNIKQNDEFQNAVLKLTLTKLIRDVRYNSKQQDRKVIPRITM